MVQHFVDLDCTEVSDSCPVENTIYGYAPSLPLTIFFIASYAILALTNLVLGLKHKTYFFGYVLTIGSISEIIGYVGRFLLYYNPYRSMGFQIQISCLIFAPSFIAAGIYIMLQDIVKVFGTERSRVKPMVYTWAFIACDTVSLLLQAAGGGIAGGAGKNANLRARGTNVMMAGIVFQVFTLVVFMVLVGDYVIRTRLAWDQVDQRAKNVARRTSFRIFEAGVIVAFVGVFCRCVYRIAEMAGGWANPIMRDEAGFSVMEGFMVLVATAALTVFHPGYCFPEIHGEKLEPDSFNTSEQDFQMIERGIDK